MERERFGEFFLFLKFSAGPDSQGFFVWGLKLIILLISHTRVLLSIDANKLTVIETSMHIDNVKNNSKKKTDVPKDSSYTCICI